MTTATDTNRPRAFSPELASSLGTGSQKPGWDVGTERRIDDGETLATGLGWFSIALGVAEAVAPEKLAGQFGLDDRKNLFRLYGFREIATGAGILSNRRPAGWMWGRVAGDVIDLATLAAGLRGDNANRKKTLAAMSAVLGVTVVDVICARQLERTRETAARQRQPQN